MSYLIFIQMPLDLLEDLLGSLLNHVEFFFFGKNSNLSIVSRITNVAGPHLFMIFDILIS